VAEPVTTRQTYSSGLQNIAGAFGGAVLGANDPIGRRPFATHPKEEPQRPRGGRRVPPDLFRLRAQWHEWT
jgi:hypothetical protein